MALAPGTRLGAYEIVGLIGAGGMGEVYRATDTNLGRQVAIKVLPDTFAHDPERTARFDREARTLAALNHPHIASVYGLERSDRTAALIMELVEGATLADRIGQGPIPLDEALPIARQIAEALEAAHEIGIVHRDLKPANIKVRPDGTVKVLDFGLAKALAGDPLTSPVALTNSPTITSPVMMTGIAVLLGTAAYMSPEQAAGRAVDRRADLWAFGVVLFEMLTGRPLFSGETVSHTLAGVLRAPIDLSQLPLGTPTSMRELLTRCLDRDLKTRLQASGEARIAIDRALKEPETGGASRLLQGKGRVLVPWMIAGLLGTVASGIGVLHFNEESRVTERTRFQIFPPDQVTIGNSITLSPDGRTIVFIGIGTDGHPHLFVHPLDSLTSERLTGTDGAEGVPFWSPDSQSIVFGAQGKLKKIAASGGPTQVLCDSQFSVGGGFWTADGTVVFGGNPNLMKVSASGGVPSPVTTLARGDSVHAIPTLLPDGRHFVYARLSGQPEQSGVFLGSLDAGPDEQAVKRLLPDSGTGPVYVRGSSKALGYLLFVRQNTLMAQRFDQKQMETVGNPFPIAEGVPSAFSRYWASASGVLIYQAAAATPTRELSWFDRLGKPIGTVGPPDAYESLALSPDGTELAVSRRVGDKREIYLLEFARNAFRRFTFGQHDNDAPIWSPDGRSIVFSSNRDGVFNVLRKASNGGGTEETIVKSDSNRFVTDWSRDGKFLLQMSGRFRDRDLFISPVGGNEQVSASFPTTEFNDEYGQFSPDGRWVAYQSDESGTVEVYVRPFPASADGGKWVVSQSGGYQPRWRGDGKEVLYFSGSGTLMAADVSTSGSVFRAGVPRTLFQAPILLRGVTTGARGYRWDISSDGERFLVITTRGQAAPPPITVVLNWDQELKRLVPAK